MSGRATRARARSTGAVSEPREDAPEPVWTLSRNGLRDDRRYMCAICGELVAVAWICTMSNKPHLVIKSVCEPCAEKQ